MSVSSLSAKSGRSIVEVSTAFRSPATQRLLEYWQAKRGARARPWLSDLDLMELYDVASAMTIRDAVDGGQEFRCRYWGTQLVNFFGLEATGKLLRECYSPASARVLADRMRLAIDQPEPVRVVAVVDLIETLTPRTYEAIWLGLDGADGSQHAIAVFGIGYELTADERRRYEDPEDWTQITYPDDDRT